MNGRWMAGLAIVVLTVAALLVFRGAVRDAAGTVPEGGAASGGVVERGKEAGRAIPAIAGDRLAIEGVEGVEGVEAAAAAGENDEPVVLLRGRAVDGRRFPAEGADVTVCGPRGVVAEERTAGDGSFEVRLPLARWPGRAAVLVRWRERFAAADRHFGDLPNDRAIDFGAIVLGEAGALPVRVLRGGVPAAGATVRLALFDCLVAEGTSGADGACSFERLPPGTWLVLASTEEAARSEMVDLPWRGEEPVALEMWPLYDLPVRVVSRATGEPVAGAAVAIAVDEARSGPSLGLPIPWGAPPLPTDDRGRTTLSGVPLPARLAITAMAAGFRPQQLRKIFSARLEGTALVAAELEIALEPARRLTWPVENGEMPATPSGTEITFRAASAGSPRSAPPLPPGRIEGTELVVEGVTRPGGLAFAVAPDGSVAEVRYASDVDRGRAIRFARPRAIEVVVRDVAGRPVERFEVAARSEDGNGLEAAAVTDTGGRARLDVLGLRRFTVKGGFESRWASGPNHLGTVDTTAGDARLEAVIGAARPVVVAVTLDGERRLPAHYSLTVGNAVRGPIAEDPERGELRLDVRVLDRERPPTVLVNARGYPLSQAQIPDGAAEGPARVELALRMPSRLSVVLTPPEEEHYRVELERWDPAAGAWNGTPARGRPGERLPGGRRRTIYLIEEPGTYRACDYVSRVASDAVTFGDEAAVREVALDLAALAAVEGRVVLPPGTDVSLVRIQAEGEGFAIDRSGDALDRQASGTRPAPDGAFQCRVPGDRAVVLRPWHPWLVPSKERGEATVTAPASGVVLELVEAASAVIRIRRRPETPPMPPGETLGRSYRRVLLYEGAARGQPAAECVGVLDEGVLRFGGFRADTWTVWIDGPEGVPVILAGVLLREGANDLGEVTPEAGSSVRVAILTPAGQAAPHVAVAARPVEEPGYFRVVNSDGESEVVLSGLGAGRFRVSVSSSSPPRREERTVEVDGRGSVSLDFDLR